MGYPRGQVDHAIGTVEWQMLSPTEISVSCSRAMIHNIVYHASICVQKHLPASSQEWRALYGDLCMRRLVTNGEPTMKAKQLFKELAEQIAREHDNEAIRSACKIAELREKKRNTAEEIAKLKAKIFVLEGVIADVEAELREVE